MKRLLAVILLLLALPWSAFGQSVKLPETVSGKPGAWIIVPAESDGGFVQWYMPDAGLTEVPLGALFGDEWSRKAHGRVFTSETPGRYRVVAYVAKGDAASPVAVCTVVVGEPPPVPPGPGPVPPGPGPGPTPADPLTGPLADAYKADGSPQPQARALASVYRLASTSTVNDAALATLGDLYGVVSKAGAALVPLAAMQAERKVIAAELAAKLGNVPTTALDATTRAKCGEQFARISRLLEGVSK